MINPVSVATVKSSELIKVMLNIDLEKRALCKNDQSLKSEVSQGLNYPSAEGDRDVVDETSLNSSDKVRLYQPLVQHFNVSSYLVRNLG